jgi:hypothetical protein
VISRDPIGRLFTLEQEHPGLIRVVSGIDDVKTRLDQLQHYVDVTDANVRSLFTYFAAKEYKQRMRIW